MFSLGVEDLLAIVCYEFRERGLLMMMNESRERDWERRRELS